MSLACPACRVDLVMAERLGVEIDYCPKCRGVWLDRGELDKIIDRADDDGPNSAHVRPAPASAVNTGLFGGPPVGDQRYAPGYRKRDDDDDDDQRRYAQPGHGQSYGRHKKKNWLSELFD